MNGERDKRRESSARLTVEQEAKKREAEQEDKTLLLRREEIEAEERKEMKRMQMENEKIEHGLITPNTGGGEGGEWGVERSLVRSLQLIPDFDEERVSEWFIRFEKKAREFKWPRERWIGLVANKLMGKALEAYDKMSLEHRRSMRSLRVTSCELMNYGRG